jgi:hypothetical protein
MPHSFGTSNADDGVTGTSGTGRGVVGESAGQVGVFGLSTNFVGVWGESQSPATAGQPGVFGKSPHWQGVHGESTDQVGVFGISTNFVGVWGESQSRTQPGVFGKGIIAGRFDGDVEVSGDVRLTGGQDCAERFEVAASDSIDPGTVMVIGLGGTLEISAQSYDKRVAGVVSGAGRYKPAIILDQQGPESSGLPIALVGKVYCKVDAEYSGIEIGDLLTTSPTRGHAMKASDTIKAFGAVIGKALQPLSTGQGLIPILITLQ